LGTPLPLLLLGGPEILLLPSREDGFEREALMVVRANTERREVVRVSGAVNPDCPKAWG
jgi:hypothetical protein